MNEGNQRIIRNSLALYVRMAINLAIGLYTSRVVLNVLGVEDYGIYGVVAGVVSFMGFINASMTSATSRFLNYAIGKGDETECKKTFSTAVVSHLLIAMVILLLGETVGLWFVVNKLVIPPERLTAALWAYHLALISACIGLSFVPYSSTIVAHEKMNFFAFFEILKSTLNLAIVFVLKWGEYDKLILYAILGLAVQIVCCSIVYAYTAKNFRDAKSVGFADRNIFKKMFTFLSQTIFAHMSFSFRLNGNNVVLNILFGTVANAANGIAMTIQGVLLQFSSNINIAFTPQIIQEYSNKNYTRANALMLYGSRLSLMVVLLFIVPLWIEMPEILKLWLKIMPEYAVTFSKIILLTVVMSAITTPVYTGLSATGDIKAYSIAQGLVYLSVPFVFYIVAKTTPKPELAYILVLLSQLIAAIILFISTRKKICCFSIRKYVFHFVAILVPVLFSVISASFVSMFLDEGIVRVCIVVCVSSISMLFFYYFLLTKNERTALKRIIRGNR